MSYTRSSVCLKIANVIGETAHAYATEHEGKKAFLFVLEERQALEGDNAASQVLQLDEKVLQLLGENSIEARLSALESQIEELKSLLFDYKAKKDTQFTKERKSQGRGRDSNPRRGLHRAAF
jgi:uncharacterized small protein (DUF1192 family)